MTYLVRLTLQSMISVFSSAMLMTSPSASCCKTIGTNSLTRKTMMNAHKTHLETAGYVAAKHGYLLSGNLSPSSVITNYCYHRQLQYTPERLFMLVNTDSIHSAGIVIEAMMIVCRGIHGGYDQCSQAQKGYVPTGKQLNHT